MSENRGTLTVRREQIPRGEKQGWGSWAEKQDKVSN